MQTTTVDDLSAYRALATRVRDAGLMQGRPWYYSVKISATVSALVAGLVALFLVGNSPTSLAVAAFLAVASTQVIFLGHDAGHQQVFRHHRANWLLGLGVGNLLSGLSFGWWVPKHNAHHAHPNQPGLDPDIGAGVVAFTPEVASGRRGVGRLMAQWQAWLFFPLLLLEGIGLQVASVQTVLHKRDRRGRVELALLGLHCAAYLFIVFWVLSPLMALAFIAVHQALIGLYLGCSFAPNHTGMPTVDGDTPMSFARRQVTTARNITGGRVATFMLGGLNYQIEHHLFPSMPRPNLARAQTVIRAFCADQQLEYRQDGLIASYRQALGHLRRVGNGGG